MLRKVYINMQNNEIGPFSNTLYKTKFKMSLNLRANPIKLLEENIWGKVFDIILGNNSMTS
jgi:hypothetical protein